MISTLSSHMSRDHLKKQLTLAGVSPRSLTINSKFSLTSQNPLQLVQAKDLTGHISMCQFMTMTNHLIIKTTIKCSQTFQGKSSLSKNSVI